MTGDPLTLLRAGEHCTLDDRYLMALAERIAPTPTVRYKPPASLDVEGFVIRLIVALFAAHGQREGAKVMPLGLVPAGTFPNVPNITTKPSLLDRNDPHACYRYFRDHGHTDEQNPYTQIAIMEPPVARFGHELNEVQPPQPVILKSYKVRL